MASDAKVCFSSKVEYRAVVRYLYLKGKTGKEIHGELADVYGLPAPSYARVKFWVVEFKGGKTSLSQVWTPHWMPLTKKCVRKFFPVSIYNNRNHGYLDIGK